MSTTVAIGNAPTSYSDVSIALMDQTKLRPRANFTPVSTKNQAIAEYVYADGDDTVETIVRVTITRAANGFRQHSIRLTTTQVRTVDSVAQQAEPLDVTVAWNTPGAMPEPDKVLKLLGSCFSLAADGLTSKVPNDGIFSAMNWGIVEGLYG